MFLSSKFHEGLSSACAKPGGLSFLPGPFHYWPTFPPSTPGALMPPQWAGRLA